MTTIRRPGADADLLDVTRLDDLVADLADADLVADLVRTFLSELPERLDLVASGGETARRAAHALSSSSAMLGATVLAARAAEVERGAGEAGLLVAAPATATAMRRWLARSVAAASSGAPGRS